MNLKDGGRGMVYYRRCRTGLKEMGNVEGMDTGVGEGNKSLPSSKGVQILIEGRALKVKKIKIKFDQYQL